MQKFSTGTPNVYLCKVSTVHFNKHFIIFFFAFMYVVVFMRVIIILINSINNQCYKCKTYKDQQRALFSHFTLH